MRIPTVDGVEIEVHDLGGDGPPVLLCHATGFHGLVWEPLAARLDGYHRWSMDMRAHGDSTTPVERPLEWYGFADDILCVVDALGLERPFAVGHSKGAAALLLAEQARPGTFRALWLYEPVVIPTAHVSAPSIDNPLSQGALRRRETFASRDEAFDNYASKRPFSTLHPEVLRHYVDHGFADDADGTVSLKCAPADEAQVYAHGLSHEAFASLGEVRCPTTIAVGHEDVPPAMFARSIAEALPDGRLDEYGDLAHFGPLEDPERIAAAITAAFATVD